MSFAKAWTDLRRRHKPLSIRISQTFSRRQTRSNVGAKLRRVSTAFGTEFLDKKTKGLRIRDWALAFAEFCLSFSWNSFMARAQSERALGARNMTPGDEMRERMFWMGCAGLGNLIIGFVSDSYFTHHGILMINVVLQFAIGSLLFMTEIILETSSENEYGLALSRIFVWTMFPIRSTDFARYVFQFEQLTAANNDIIMFYAFVVRLADSLGSLFFLVIRYSGISRSAITFFAFCANGLVVFLYAYILLPDEKSPHFNPPTCAGKICGIIITEIQQRRAIGSVMKNKQWLDLAEIKYSQGDIDKTRVLLKVCAMVLPTVGFTLFMSASNDIFREFWANLKFNRGQTLRGASFWIVQSSTALMMVIMEILIFPAMRSISLKVNFTTRFICGYVGLLVAIFFAAITLAIVEKIHIRPSIGFVRVFNTRSQSVDLSSKDLRFTKLNFTVAASEATTVRYSLAEGRLFKMKIKINEQNSYVSFFSVHPNKMTGYVVLDPPEVVRIQGFIPINEGPPGNNSNDMPRCFAVNMIRAKRETSIEMTNVDTGESTRLHNLMPGVTTVVQIAEGTYRVSLVGTDVALTGTLLTGGIYGIFAHADLHDYRLAFDQVLPGNDATAFLGLGVTAPLGVAKGLGYAALHAFVFVNAPVGLTGLAFGFLMFLEYITSWSFLFGFYSLHRFMNADVLRVYSFGASAFFFLCLVLLTKYREAYVI